MHVARLEERDGTKPQSLYFELRTLGANPRLATGLLSHAVGLGRADIVHDLIASGYDWGKREPEGSDWHASSELDSASLEKLRVPLTHWIDEYIRAGVFTSADETVFYLFKKDENALGLKLLRAASKHKAFDRQHNFASTNRLRIVDRLVWLRHAAWAKRVFEETPRLGPVTYEDMYEAGRICDFGVLAVFAAARDYCLFSSVLSVPQKKRVLRLMERDGQVTPESLVLTLEYPESSWIMKTEVYRHYRRQIQQLQGRVGIVFGRFRREIVVGIVAPGSPAEHAGVRAGDRLIAVNDIPVDPHDIDGILWNVRGAPLSEVRIEIMRGDQTITLELNRRLLDLSNSKMPPWPAGSLAIPYSGWN